MAHGVVRLMLAVVILGAVFMAGVGMVQSQYQQSVTGAYEPTTITNESFTVNEGDRTVLNESNRDVVYNETVQVYQNGTEFESDGNYTWTAANGTIFVPNGSGLTNNSTANVTYQFTVPDEQQQLARDVGMIPGIALSEGLLLGLGGALLIGAIAVLASLQT